MFNNTELKRAAELIEAMVHIDPCRGREEVPVDFAQKLDRLAELIDALRFSTGCFHSEDSASALRPDAVHVDSELGKLHFYSEGNSPSLDQFAANKLMLPLLDFLYANPGKGRRVLAIIRDFVRQYLPQCHLSDFQRTATGVIRIETNVRFAAHQLRRNGLLQFTRAEAFKTWRLSLLGILAADHRQCGFQDDIETSHHLITETLLARLDPLRQMHALVQKLERICKTPSGFWEKREKFLRLTMDAVSEYQGIFDPNRQLTKNQREEEAGHLLIRLNNSLEAEFVVCLFDGAPVQQLHLL